MSIVSSRFVPWISLTRPARVGSLSFPRCVRDVNYHRFPQGHGHGHFRGSNCYCFDGSFDWMNYYFGNYFESDCFHNGNFVDGWAVMLGGPCLAHLAPLLFWSEVLWFFKSRCVKNWFDMTWLDLALFLHILTDCFTAILFAMSTIALFKINERVISSPHTCWLQRSIY